MGVFSKLEGGLDSAFDRAAGAVFRGPIEPAQIAKRAEKEMNREKLVGSGRQYAPTLYTVLVNQSDDNKLFGFYPTMAAEIETYLVGKGTQAGLKFDGRPLVRFIVDKKLKSGKFEVIAENVAAPIVLKLRDEEDEYYGIKNSLSAKLPAMQLGAGKMRNLLPEHYGDDYIPGIDDAYGVGVSAGAAVAGAGMAGVGAAGAGAAGAVVAGAAGVGAAVATQRGGSPYDIGSISSTSLPNTVLGHARLTDLNAGRTYPLNKPLIVIGREDGCDIKLIDANVSRKHAQLTQDVTGTWKVTDLGSTNGSKLNGSPVTKALLCDGDVIIIGITTLEFRENRS